VWKCPQCGCESEQDHSQIALVNASIARDKAGDWIAARDEAIAHCLEQGVSMRSIAAELSMSHGGISKILKRRAKAAAALQKWADDAGA
jgi:DNA-binding NarL/FixJ family response regulator